MATKKAEPTKDKKGTKPSKNAWLKYSAKEKKAVFDFAEGYGSIAAISTYWNASSYELGTPVDSMLYTGCTGSISLITR